VTPGPDRPDLPCCLAGGYPRAAGGWTRGLRLALAPGRGQAFAGDFFTDDHPGIDGASQLT
jgi:hypothetical protein